MRKRIIYTDDIFIAIFLVILGMGIGSMLHSLYVTQELKEFSYDNIRKCNI